MAAVAVVDAATLAVQHLGYAAMNTAYTCRGVVVAWESEQ